MSNHADFLVEIHTEELPPKALRKLAESFRDEIKKRLQEAKLEFSDATFFATPRRLAVKVDQLIAKQIDSMVERRGPAWQAAYDASGQPTPACAGFARSCNITPEQLTIIENAQGKWVGFNQTVLGKTAEALLPEIVQQSLSALPIPKRMRWGSNTAEFVRPVHSVILLYGTKVIEAEILGNKTGQQTQGHRFLCTKALKISSPEKYTSILEKEGHVLADFFQRKNKIREEAEAIVARTLGNKAKAMMDENLLDEVTGLVEWPVAILGKFDAEFLHVPQEALISAMQDHQRYFPVVDENNKLLAHFITISNIESKNVEQVIEGNERVLRARLADAAFFFEMDKKVKLIDRLEKLKGIVFQAKLGSLYDKVERISKLAAFIAPTLKLDAEQAKRAGLLSKADLPTELVGEFPELQGIAGFYYAQLDNENEAVAKAIKEHYQPRFSGDELPASMLGCAIALADRVDTLTGIFSIGLLPTGDKDPFGLRRAALGILRILIEKKINLDLGGLLQQSATFYKADPALANQVWKFMLDRLEPWYQEQGISVDVFRSVISAIENKNPYDIDRRIHAVHAFKKLPEAEALAAANKRVSNILAQYNKPIQQQEVNTSLFEHDAERELARALSQYENEVASLVKAEKYQDALTLLTKLREPVDAFFDHVMVMVDDQKKRENRLLILEKLRKLFLQVADIAMLQS